jgi:protein O-GlcNAc transferase
LTTGALNNLGARLLADGDLAGAAGAFERAIRSDPDYPGAYQNLASIQMRQGRTRDAVRTFLAGLAHEPARADEATVEMALALRERGEPALAIELLSRARAIRPPSYTLTLNLGTLLGEQGRFAEALACFRQACDLEPASAVAWRNVAVAAARLGALDEARRAARRSLELDAAQPELRELAGR